MNKLKLSINLSLVCLSMLGSSLAFAKNIKVSIGKLDEGKELIVPHETVEHEVYCNGYSQAVPVYIRTNTHKIQLACAKYGTLDSYVVPIGIDEELIESYLDGDVIVVKSYAIPIEQEGITFITKHIKYREAILDVDKKKIR